MSLVPPGRYPISTFRFLAAAPTFLVRCGAPLATLRSAGRGLRYLGAAGRLHAKGRHYYLMLLGVMPERHGQGVGRRLLTHAIELAEREGVPVYLETNQETNIRFYEGSGFEVTATIRPDPRGPSLWAMVRRGAPTPPQ
jgi:GNAT superfamily N-acetyltransferase